MTTDKRGVSALLLRRQLSMRRYETAWLILHRLRRAMVNVSPEPLLGDIENDDTWTGGAQPGIRGSRQLKGRQAVIVFVAAKKRADRSGRVRVAVVPGLQQTTMVPFARANVAPGAMIYTDGLKGWDGVQARGRSARCPHAAEQNRVGKKARRRSCAGGPRDRQPPTVAGRHIPWRQS